MLEERSHFVVKETFTKGKRQDQQFDEDRFIVTDNFIAVIDGCTNVSDKTMFQ